MRANELLDLQRRKPFTALRIHLSDGAEYEVRHPELMTVTRNLVFIALPPGPDGVPERGIHCDPVHITRVEPMNGG